MDHRRTEMHKITPQSEHKRFAATKDMEVALQEVADTLDSFALCLQGTAPGLVPVLQGIALFLRNEITTEYKTAEKWSELDNYLDDAASAISGAKDLL